MIKKIVSFTVAVLFIFLFGCQSTRTQFILGQRGATSPLEHIARKVLYFSSHSVFNFFVSSHAEWTNNLHQKSDSHPFVTNYFKIEGEKQQKTDIRISNYDELIKRLSLKYDYDWRFISAIAYNESRFIPSVISHRGAEGLMQIMPIVAKEFKVTPSAVIDPEVNILLGIKLLNKIEKMLKFSPDIDPTDKMSIMLACYNGGIGHIFDARRLAAKYGANPDSWNDISYYLGAKSSPLYSSDELVKHGTFRGAQETLSFVGKVINSYEGYCQL